jgi:RNA polymerase sigma-70 factor (ECF subfamily)
VAACDDSLAGVIGRAQRGDPGAFDELVEQFSSGLYGLLCRLTGSRHEAEDLLQDTWLRVVRTIRAYRHRARFEAWLYRIAINLARDRVRRRQRRRAAGEHMPGEPETEAELDARRVPQPGPEHQLELAEEVDRLQRALERLSTAEREVIMLRHFSDMSFKEIGELMGTPIGTALARAHRGLAHLRQIMEAEDAE